jgi:hypothetical protein
LAAGRCTNPDCGQDCIRFFSADPTILGEMAHIIDKRGSGTRRRAGGGPDTYDNLILLCPTHHTEIDKAPEGTFPVELLHQWKTAHQKKIRDLLSVKKFPGREGLFKYINRLMIDNYQTYRQFGPSSDEAKSNPISNAAAIWGIRKVSQIVPNNASIGDVTSVVCGNG